MIKNLIWLRCGMFLVLTLRLFAADAGTASSDLADGFAQPPESAKPRVYWFWLGGSISREGITADLEAMKQAGIGGTLIMNAYPSTPPIVLDCMSPQWWGLLSFAASESQRLGPGYGHAQLPRLEHRRRPVDQPGTIDAEIDLVRDQGERPESD